MNKKKYLLTIIFSVAAYTISFLISFFLTKYVTGTIGTEAYGFIALAKTVASYTIIVTTALNSFATRYISVAYHKSDYSKANEYFNTVLFSNLTIGVVLVCLCTIFIAPAMNFLNVPLVLKTDVGILFVLVYMNLSISLSSTAFQASAMICHRLHIVAFFKFISYLSEGLVLLFLFVSFDAHLFYVGAGMILGTLVLLLTYIFITKRFTPQLSINVKFFKFTTVKELCVNGIWYSINSLGNTLNSGIDLIVSNVLLSALIMGQVSIIKTLTSIFHIFYSIVSQPFEPIFLELYSNGKKEELLKNLKYSMKVTGLISNLAFSGFIAVGHSYYNLWLPSEDIKLLYCLSIIAILSCILDGPMYPLYYIYTLTINNRFPCLVTIVGGIFNILSMIVMITVFNWGIYSIFISTAIVMLVINGISNPIYMAKCLNIPVKTFYPTLIRNVLSCLMMTVCLVAFAKLFNVTNWFVFVYSCICLCIAGTLIHFVIVFGFKETIETVKKILVRFKLIER